MSRRSGEKIPGAFVPILRHTMKSAAWRAASVGARTTFLALTSNYNSKAQNAVFLSSRDGAKEFGVHKDTARRWLHELEHYGFVVEVQGAHLGLTGVGKAARYRLTDRHFAGQPPTRDFEKWDGVLYNPKKQNPVREKRPPCPKKPDIRGSDETPENGNKCPTEPDIRDADDCPKISDITSLTTPDAEDVQSFLPRLLWTKPALEEIDYTEELRKLYRCEVMDNPHMAAG